MPPVAPTEPQTMDNIDHTSKLADFLAQLSHDQLPQEVIEQAKRSILNAIGCGLGSCRASPATKAIKALLSRSSRTNDGCTIIGHREPAGFDTAVLVNGISITTADYDDTHLRTVIHPSGTPLAALLSWAEMHPMSGKDFILAFVAGVETQCAVGNALGPSHYKDGWHITGTTGHFAAAAAIAKAMRLDSAQFTAALGHASTMAGGLRAMFGVDTKTLHMGRGAQDGILAARLAAQGFGSCTRPIEAWLKLVSTTVDETQLSALAESRSWQILENTFKPYPCGIVIHPLIDGCLEAHRYFAEGAEGEAPFHSRLVSIDVVVNPQCVRLCSVRHPQTQLQTIFSLYHGCAVGLVHGAAGPAEFSDEVAAQDATVRAVRDKINVTTDDKVRDDEAYLTFKYEQARNGGGERADLAEKSFHVEHATGSVARPMTIEQLERKFSDQAIPVIGAQKTKAAIEACWSLEDTEDVAQLVKLLVP
ncbi:hypothetical protein PV08_01378 [Exophiala spinifera]|uniref:MmgE/PrpD family protein n=1 Tax=Exophiala spinifera TaxID=91928 RepID=A0A0D2BQP9_9EURO|nr:uncharacterized protein PV08_01378 [Exophiala spinifera]KIW20800.1 hypothetical protein PV08_01378 [Exophiala spinifera]